MVVSVTAMSTTHWYGLYKRLTIALQDALGCLTPESTGRAVHAPELSFARAALNAAVGDALAAWNAAHADALMRLPPELALDVFRRLELRERVAVSHVSRRWRAVALADRCLWNAATFSGRKVPAAYTPPRRWRRGPPTGPLRLRARILRELLERSAPGPFSLTWEDEMLPQRIVEIVLENMHRMQALTAGLSRRSFQRICAVPAPELRSFVCTRYGGRCVHPARWDAPVLRKLELLSLRFPRESEIARLGSIEDLVLVEAPGLERRGIKLSAVFPALNSLEIVFFTSEMIPCLSTMPATLSSLTLIARRSIDYEPVVTAFRRCRPKRLHLSSARDVAPVLALFVSVVPGTWTMAINPRADARAIIRTHFRSDEGAICFSIDGSEPLAFAREPRLASYLDRVSALAAPVHVLAQLDGLPVEQWDRRLPALRALGLGCAQGTAAWPASVLPPIRTPSLERVSVSLQDAGSSWAPSVLRARFVYARPLLAQITVEAKRENGLEENSLAELRALAELVIVDLGHVASVYAHQ